MGGIFGLRLGRKPAAAYGASDRGRTREQNEDSFRLLEKERVYLVADGMGGHNAGEVASKTAVRIAGDYFTPERVAGMRAAPGEIQGILAAAVQEAQEGVTSLARSNPEYQGMGCTMAIVFINDRILHTCHVGDSRIYVVAPDGIRQIGSDHTTAAELIREGRLTREEARSGPLAGQLTQAVGGPSVAPEYNECTLSEDDLVLLCSDGLWDMLAERDIQEMVQAGGALQDICHRLIAAANDAGGYDNITVVVAKADG